MLYYHLFTTQLSDIG
uniref:Uncharacterized protein n=1 Tax=Arundo donax TaxID=35708 RepID=A0A0A9AGF3_ARUDO